MRSFQTGLDPKLSHQTAGWPISDAKRNFKGSKRGPNFGTLGEKFLPAQLGLQRSNTSLSSPKPTISAMELKKAKFTLRHIQEVLNPTYIIIDALVVALRGTKINSVSFRT
jgi:hypothetical protein